jgi:hypothetical protein
MSATDVSNYTFEGGGSHNTLDYSQANGTVKSTCRTLLHTQSLVITVGLAFGWPLPDGRVRVGLGILVFIVTAIVIAMLRAPRVAAFDRQRRLAFTPISKVG